ncbi:MAG TPA: hypothetical protein VF944_04425 [Candidatus Bathyarchaeia archaeon]
MRRFRITGHSMGCVEVFLNMQQDRWYDECETDEARHDLVAHEAWRRLWDSEAKTMLKVVCDELGVDTVYRTFKRDIRVEEI